MRLTSTKISVTLLVGIVLATIFPNGVSAQNAGREQIQQGRQESITAACNRVGQSIDNITARYEAKKERHVYRYQQIKQNVTELVLNLKEKGYDVSKVEANLAELNQMTLRFANEYNQFASTLLDAKTYACGSSQGEHRGKIEEARGYLTQSRQTGSEIVDFIRNTLRPSIVDLKNQTPNQY